MTERFELRFVRGHVEVYDRRGAFVLSADTMTEAQDELRELAA